MSQQSEGARLIHGIHRDARTAAVRDLIETYPGAYRLLYEAHVERLKAARGWKPQERAGRPRSTPRDGRGRWQ